VKPEVLAALIAAGAALVVAIISLISAILSKRVSSEASRDMALMKRHFEQFDSAQTLSDGELKVCLEGLEAACATTQVLKDEIQLFAFNPTTYIQSSDTVQRLGAPALGIREAFKDELAHMSTHERDVFHGIKDHAQEILVILARIGDEKKPLKDVNALRNRLVTIRDKLTVGQNDLIRCREERIVQRTVRLRVSM
jgi:hypothetical protein